MILFLLFKKIVVIERIWMFLVRILEYVVRGINMVICKIFCKWFLN